MMGFATLSNEQSQMLDEIDLFAIQKEALPLERAR